MTEATKATKRFSGDLTKEGNWKVVTESQKLNEGYMHRCGTELLVKVILASIHDAPFPLTGGGDTQQIPVPFCPDCERITVNGTIDQAGRIIISS